MSKYYSFRVFVEQFPSVVDNNAVYAIAEKISEMFQCNYDRLGYVLLHPENDDKDIGRMFPNDSLAKEKFIELDIPTIFNGKVDYPAAPFITFELNPQDSLSLSDFTVVFRYPVYETSPLVIEIDVKAELLIKPVTISQYSDILNRVIENGYQINSAFVHHYSGNMKRLLLDGGQSGFCTLDEMLVINKAVKYQGANYKNKLMDIFLINSISNKAISSTVKAEICKIIGNSNVLSGNSVYTFTLPNSSNPLFINACKKKLRKLLKRENLLI